MILTRRYYIVPSFSLLSIGWQQKRLTDGHGHASKLIPCYICKSHVVSRQPSATALFKFKRAPISKYDARLFPNEARAHFQRRRDTCEFPNMARGANAGQEGATRVETARASRDALLLKAVALIPLRWMRKLLGI